SAIKSCVPRRHELFQVLLTPLVNDNSDPEAFREARVVAGCKIFWQGVSNDYGNSISCAEAIVPFIKASARTSHYSERQKQVVTMHAECLKDYKGRILPIKDR